MNGYAWLEEATLELRKSKRTETTSDQAQCLRKCIENINEYISTIKGSSDAVEIDNIEDVEKLREELRTRLLELYRGYNGWPKEDELPDDPDLKHLWDLGPEIKDELTNQDYIEIGSNILQKIHRKDSSNFDEELYSEIAETSDYKLGYKEVETNVLLYLLEKDYCFNYDIDFSIDSVMNTVSEFLIKNTPVQEVNYKTNVNTLKEVTLISDLSETDIEVKSNTTAIEKIVRETNEMFKTSGNNLRLYDGFLFWSFEQGKPVFLLNDKQAEFMEKAWPST